MTYSLLRIRTSAAAIFAATTMFLAGCATNYGPDTVPPGATRTAATVRAGTVTSVRQVTIRPDNSVIGSVAGGTAGGLLGSQVGGRGTTQALGALGGALLGGFIGNEAGKAAGTRKGYAYVVQFTNGERREIVQGADVLINPGSRVNVIFRADGAVVTPVV